MIYIGTAGWAISKEYKDQFGDGESVLERYSTRLNCVEINSSFYKTHKASTYERWARTVPEGFKFSVKLWKKFTHEQRFDVAPSELLEVLDPILHLEDRLGCLLVQLPPSFSFLEERSKQFFSLIRKVYHGPITCEPRHASWKTTSALHTLRAFRISLVHADPDPIGTDVHILQENEFYYLRLHGSPEIYKSAYDQQELLNYVRLLSSMKKTCWCVFDNTTFGYATLNALQLLDLFSSTKPDFSYRSDAKDSNNNATSLPF